MIPSHFYVPTIKDMIYDSCPGDYIWDVIDLVIREELAGFIHNDNLVRRTSEDSNNSIYIKWNAK